MSTFATELSILGPALIAGFLVVLSHVPLGQQVLSRGIVFIDLAIAQVAGLGVVAADAMGWNLRAGPCSSASPLRHCWRQRRCFGASTTLPRSRKR